jgi:carbon monoxide dehydrogenase subunit G
LFMHEAFNRDIDNLAGRATPREVNWMHLEGSFETSAPRQVVWDFLLNPNVIAPCFPDLQSMEILTPDSFRAKVRTGLSVVRGTMDFDFRIAEKTSSS